MGCHHSDNIYHALHSPSQLILQCDWPGLPAAPGPQCISLSGLSLLHYLGLYPSSACMLFPRLFHGCLIFILHGSPEVSPPWGGHLTTLYAVVLSHVIFGTVHLPPALASCLVSAPLEQKLYVGRGLVKLGLGLCLRSPRSGPSCCGVTEREGGACVRSSWGGLEAQRASAWPAGVLLRDCLWGSGQEHQLTRARSAWCQASSATCPAREVLLSLAPAAPDYTVAATVGLTASSLRGSGAWPALHRRSQELLGP